MSDGNWHRASIATYKFSSTDQILTVKYGNSFCFEFFNFPDTEFANIQSPALKSWSLWKILANRGILTTVVLDRFGRIKTCINRI